MGRSEQTAAEEPAGESLEAVAAEITMLRTKVYVDRTDPRPWAPSVNEATERRLAFLRRRRGELILFEVRRGHDPVDIAARARLDSADVARLLARTMRDTTPNNQHSS